MAIKSSYVIDENVEDGEDVPTASSLLEIPVLPLSSNVLKVAFINLTIDGLLNTSLYETYFDAITSRYYLRVKLPEITCKANCKIEGKMLGLPVKGEGKCTIKFIDGDYFFSFATKAIPFFGPSNTKQHDVQFVCILNKVHFDFEDLCNGNAHQNAEMNNLLNNNWAEVIYDMKEEIISKVKMVADVLIKVPTF